MAIRSEFTGMLPAAIGKFEELITLAAGAGLNPAVVKGYEVSPGKNDFASWGAGCRMQCADLAELRQLAEGIGITWVSDAGDLAYAEGLTIEDFQTCRVDGDLTLQPASEEEA